MEKIIRAAARGMERAAKMHNKKPAVRNGQDIPFHFGIIVCALRFFVPAMSWYYQHLHQVMSYAPPKQIFAAASLEQARAAVYLAQDQGLPVVGFDLAGAEAGFPAGDHRAAFQYAHSNFLRKTIHAGEAYGPESIFQAITDCYANRIGHGTWLFEEKMIRTPSIRKPAHYVNLLAEYIASQRITIEVCLTSNLQTSPQMRTPGRHPLRKMIEHDLSVSICTDNRLVSNTTVTRELQLACEAAPMTRRQFKNIIIAGFKGSFFNGSYAEKRAYVRQVIKRYNELELQFMGLTAPERMPPF
jgi:adenosine deaminase